MTQDIKLGDRITFRAACRWNRGEKVTRKVTGFYGPTYCPTVRYGGYGGFVVWHAEIIHVQDGVAK